MKKSIALSICLHVLFFTLFAINFHFSLQTLEGKTSEPFIHSYLYESHANKTSLLHQAKILLNNSNNQRLVDKTKVDIAENHERHSFSFSITQPSPAVINTNENKVSELAKKLHDVIQNNIERPKEIASLIKNKNIELIFVLFPDGTVKDLQLAKSSGIKILDTLALDAMNTIQPIIFAKDFLQRQEQFHINIVFDY
jgi:TonB family protein